jgi:SAM-dependent methyltransferase
LPYAPCARSLTAAFVLAGAARATGLDVKMQIGDEALAPGRYDGLARALCGPAAAEFLSAVGSDAATVRRRRVELAGGPWPADFLGYAGDRMPLPDGCIDLAVSKSVLEHVPLRVVAPLTSEVRRVLRPGGVTVHWIDLRDHLHILDDEDATGDWLEALRHPRPLFDAMFSRRSTAINRLRSPQWRAVFEAAGLEVILFDERRYPLPVEFRRERLQPPWQSYDLATLSVAQVCVAARRRD